MPDGSIIFSIRGFKAEAVSSLLTKLKSSSIGLTETFSNLSGLPFLSKT